MLLRAIFFTTSSLARREMLGPAHRQCHVAGEQGAKIHETNMMAWSTAHAAALDTPPPTISRRAFLTRKLELFYYSAFSGSKL